MPLNKRWKPPVQGHADWTNLTVNASTTGLSVQTPTSSLTGIDVQLTANQAIGIDLLGGQHGWANVVVEKAFTSADQTSIGLNAWYSDLTLDQFTSRNVSTGMVLEDSTAVVQSLEANIGSLAGLHLIDSSLSGNALTTIAQDRGVLMEEHLSISHPWTAQLHQTLLMLSIESTATDAKFLPVKHCPIIGGCAGRRHLVLWLNVEPDHQVRPPLIGFWRPMSPSPIWLVNPLRPMSPFMGFEIDEQQQRGPHASPGEQWFRGGC